MRTPRPETPPNILPITTDAPPPQAATRRPFGDGPAVSLFTLGTMRALESPDAMEAVVRRAVAVGVNHIETAPSYGPAERYLGSALAKLALEQPAQRAELVLTSKILPSFDAAEAWGQVLASLERLGVDKLDNLAIHGLNTEDHLRWALHGAGSELFARALGEGRVGQVGFSSHGSYSLITQALESGRFKFCALHLHLFDPSRLPLAQDALEAGMGVLAISPADKGGRLQDPPPQLIEDCAPWSPLLLAYRFLLARGISSLTVGATIPTDLDLPATLARAHQPLNTSEQAAVERLRALGKARLGQEWCGQCQACLPCPKGVPIPSLLRLRQLAIGHGLEAFAQERYNLIGRAGHWWEQVNAQACERCGDCLPRCPLHLPIPDLLADGHRRLAAAPRRRLWG
ncbi:MAG: aldo/keto reductase [Cyanobacteriota bacterium]|jgi:predicted aldo/keto reductase-like oxidoreductase